MRITPYEAAAIRRVTAEVAGEHARVSVFGSRTRDELCGGDIDLLIELPEPHADKLSLSLRAGARLQRAIGERKIDVLVVDPETEKTPLVRAARRAPGRHCPVSPGISLRQPPNDKLRFLAETVIAEAELLRITDGRVFALPMDAERAGTLRQDIDLAERVDTFVARFGRLQDTAGDKLLPAVLAWVAEPPGPAIDNLARAERLGWIGLAVNWVECFPARLLKAWRALADGRDGRRARAARNDFSLFARATHAVAWCLQALAPDAGGPRATWLAAASAT